MFSFCIQSARPSDDPVNGTVFLIGSGSIMKPIFNIAFKSMRDLQCGQKRNTKLFSNDG